eukprot:2978-Heterococcus_DN1.PRE.1
MASTHPCTAECSRSSERELFLQQQLQLQAALLASKDALLASKDEVLASRAAIAELQRGSVAGDALVNRAEALLAQQGQHLAAAEARLQRLKAASST